VRRNFRVATTVQNPQKPLLRKQWQAENATPAHPQQPAEPDDDPIIPIRRKKRRWPIVLIIFILLAGATYGAYWYGNNAAEKNRKQSTAQKAETAQPKKQTATTQPAKAVPTKHYDSAGYSIGVDYPEDWTVTDNTTKLTIVSPTQSLEAATGSMVNGHVVVTVQNQQTSIPGYPEGGAIEVLESQKISYKQPTPVQRAQTYVSYLSFGKTNALNAMYVTGDFGYTKDQAVPMGDVVKANPLISITFQSCTSDDCATGTPTMLVLPADKWAATAYAKQITALLQSITLD
jgi:hypothetical protein